MAPTSEKRYRPFKRVFIANRGEIAVRIIQALRELQLESVAIYSDADRDSLHVSLADRAYRLEGITAQETYLNVPKLIRGIIATEADAVHPGYGFLSESAAFCKEVLTKTNAVFIGPTPDVLTLMGDKIEARHTAEKNEVPVVPGSARALKSLADLEAVALRIGYPLIIKAAAGGGGRGIRIVQRAQGLKAAFEACQREAQAYFGNPEVFCERYIEHPRHIEVQIIGDSHGQAVHLFERDCSVQRRHQKLFEEAPSTFLDPAGRARICQFALRLAKAVNYVGVGTIEFICESPTKVYFMEMNTRIQVEHPVTECITGVDLIKAQLTVTSGAHLAFTQDQLTINGWAMEARINAEDPDNDFRPSGGTISRLRWATGPFVRVDSHIYVGYELPTVYDSMIAKVIVWGQTRAEAIARMERALREVEIQGVRTTISFHRHLLAHQDFRAGVFTTRFIEENKQALVSSQRETSEAELLALLSAVVAAVPTRPVALPPSNESRQWQARARAEGLK